MISAPTDAPLPSLAPLKRMAVAMALSLGILIGISRFVAPRYGTLPIGLTDVVVLPLTGLALVLILLSSRVRSFVLRRAPGLFLDPGGEGLAAAYFRATLLSFAVLEAAGILGCIVSFLTGMPRYGVIFGAAGLIAMLTRWPRDGELRRLLARRALP